MKKRYFSLCALLFTVLLTGCNQLSQYTISEQQINDALAKHNNYEKQLGVAGLLDAHIVLSDLQSQIGREEPNKITLTGSAKLDISSLLGPQQATMKLTMKTQPIFNAETGAIYLKDMEIQHIEVQPEKMQSVLETLSPYLEDSLQTYFNQKPAYVLSSDHSKAESLAKRLAKGLEVKPGELVIPLTD